jgi:hypothetical protein
MIRHVRRASAALVSLPDACERASVRKATDEWLNPTLLGSAFDAGDVEKAQELVDQVRTEGPSTWKLETTLDDCKTAAELHGEPNRSELLGILAQLVALLPTKAAISGH